MHFTVNRIIKISPGFFFLCNLLNYCMYKQNEVTGHWVGMLILLF